MGEHLRTNVMIPCWFSGYVDDVCIYTYIYIYLKKMCIYIYIYIDKTL